MTALNIQVAVDCRHAHVLADWWAETLGWVVEPSDPVFIRSMIDQGFATEADTETHRGGLVWRGAAAITPGDQLGSPERLRVLFQEVPEDKVVKNRIHLDVRGTPGSDPEATRASLEGRGATFLWAGQQGPHRWITMADPEGNEFCVS